jgi:hypothetical protein
MHFILSLQWKKSLRALVGLHITTIAPREGGGSKVRGNMSSTPLGASWKLSWGSLDDDDDEDDDDVVQMVLGVVVAFPSYWPPCCCYRTPERIAAGGG